MKKCQLLYLRLFGDFGRHVNCAMSVALNQFLTPDIIRMHVLRIVNQQIRVEIHRLAAEARDV